MTATRVPRSGLTTMAPRIEPRLPPGAPWPAGRGRPPRSRRSTARRTAPPPRARCRRASISVPCGWPAGSHPSSTRGRREDAAEVRVDDRRGAVAEVGAGQPGPRPLPHRRRACGRGSRAPARRRAGRARSSRRRPARGGRARAGSPTLAPGPKPRLRGSSTSVDAVGQTRAHDGDGVRARTRCRPRPPAPRRARPGRGTAPPCPRSARGGSSGGSRRAARPPSWLPRTCVLAMRGARGR